MSKQIKQQKRRTAKKRTYIAGARYSRAVKTIFHGIFGKPGIERVDKAKDIGDAVLKQVKNMKKEQPIVDYNKNKKNKTFSIHNNSPLHDGFIKSTSSTIVKPPRTPITRHSRSEPKLPKTTRHMTRSTQAPAVYAPTLNNQGVNPVKILDWRE